MPAATPRLLQKAAGWLTRRRIRAHALILALCAWSVVAVDFALPGMMDRAGNVKFKDFLQFYITGKLIVQGRVGALYDPLTVPRETAAMLGHPTRLWLPNAYGPQVALFFSPLSHLSFLAAAGLWVLLSVVLYFACCYAMWRACPALRTAPKLVVLLALAFPPFFRFFTLGQLSALALACFVAAFFAFRGKHDWLAGLALGTLVFKPQFLIPVGVILLATGAWKSVAGIALAGFAQLSVAWAYFGSAVMRTYIATLWWASHSISTFEFAAPQVQARSAYMQMHSLRAFWSLLVPWPTVVSALYLISSLAVVVLAALCWKSSGPLGLRFSALVFAAVLVNPHLFVYDLLVLAPALFLIADWMLQNPVHPASPALRLLLYLAYLLPLFGPVAYWTRLQLSVLAFVAIQWLLWRILREEEASNLNMASAAA